MTAPAPAKSVSRPGLELDDSMAEAARKILRCQFERMLQHEPGTRAGEDIEELHDMRVATRRMRAAFRVFGEYLDPKPVIEGLQLTGRKLGAVRDLDVFWEKTQHYIETLPPTLRDGLAPLQVAWAAEHSKARAKLLDYLDSDGYGRFKARFERYLKVRHEVIGPRLNRKGEAVPHRLRHVAPLVIHQRVVAVQAYEEWVEQPDVPPARLHRLRIAAKRLRYALEFFQEILPPQAGDLVEELKALQDHLGVHQDAVVAIGLLLGFLKQGTWGDVAEGRPEQPIVAPGVEAYLAVQEAELERQQETFPPVWSTFQSPATKKLIASVVAPL
ncbi:MAG: CHAD domain-containing protein [Anaerolineae bacterium]|jgi:CHAD domain-containing protein